MLLHAYFISYVDGRYLVASESMSSVFQKYFGNENGIDLKTIHKRQNHQA